MKILPKRIDECSIFDVNYLNSEDKNLYGLYIASKYKNSLILGKPKMNENVSILSDLLNKNAYATGLLYFVENFDLSNDINKNDLLKDINVLLHSRCEVVNEKAPLLTKIGNYPIYEGENYILRGEGENKIKETFDLKEDLNMDDITLDFLKNTDKDERIRDYVVCPKCKNVFEDDDIVINYPNIPDDYNGPVDDKPDGYSCPLCGYYTTDEENFTNAYIEDLADAPNVDEYVPGYSDYLKSLDEDDKPLENTSEEYKRLDKELDKLIASNATDAELNDFLEDASYNDNITNKEYTALVYKAQDTRRIDEDGTQAADIASKVDYSFQSAPTPAEPKKKYKPVEINELDENTYINLTGFIKDVDGYYKRGNYVLVKESDTNKLKVINKNKLNEVSEPIYQVKGSDGIVKYLDKKLNEKFPGRFEIKSGPVDDAFGLVIKDNNNHDAGDLIDVTDYINALMNYLGYDKTDYEIDYKKNNLIMAIYNDKQFISRDFVNK